MAPAADAIFAPLPLLVDRQSPWWPWLGGAIVPPVAVAFGGASWRGILGFGLMAAIGMMLMATWHLSRVRQRNRRTHPDSAGADAQALAATVLVRELERYSPWTWDQFQESREAAGLPPLRAIVDKPLEPAVRAIVRTGALLEPEQFLAGTPAMPRRDVEVGFGAGAILGLGLAVGGALQRDLWQFFGSLGFAIVCLFNLPAFRRLGVVPDSSPVAGVGFVSTADGRRWTTDDAVLLVSIALSGGLNARLVGKAGWLAMTFMGPGDESFVTLWQRWMHPAPRPELSGPG